MLISIFFAIIALLIFNQCINYINFKEENIINIRKRDKIFIFISFFLTFSLLRIDNKGLTLLLYYTFSFYLITTSYIDLKTKSIYSFLNISSLIIMILLLLPKIKYLNYKTIIVGLIIVSIFAFLNKGIMYILGHRIVGDGDIDLYFISALILSTKDFFYYVNYEYLFNNILFNKAFLLIMLSIFIGGISALFLLIIKKDKLNKTFAFAPAIAISSLFILIFI